VAASVAAKTGSSRTALAIYIEHDPNWIVALPILHGERTTERRISREERERGLDRALETRTCDEKTDPEQLTSQRKSNRENQTRNLTKKKAQTKQTKTENKIAQILEK
jgi:hypothetical protein